MNTQNKKNASSTETPRVGAMEKDAGAHVKLARKKLAAIFALEKAMQEKQALIFEVQKQLDADAEKLAKLRDETCRIVRFRGGALQLPEMTKPLHVNTYLKLQYNTGRLVPWLAKNAPAYLRQPVQPGIDKRALRKHMTMRGARAYLPETKSPVRGIRIVETQYLVIPGHDPENPICDNAATASAGQPDSQL